jgi:hypothetical protein
MIILNGTTQSFQAVMGAAAATTNPTFSVSYVDVNLTSLVTSNTTDGSLNGTTPVTILAGTTDQLNVKTVSIFNADTIQQIITVYKNISSSLYSLVKYTLNPGDSIHYDEGHGWTIAAFNSAANVVGNSFITSGTTYTTPSTISSTTQFKFTLIGAGGGGGGMATAADSATGGGGGAACIVYTQGLSPSTAYTIAIGSFGGGGSATGPTAGNAGGNTTLTIGSTTYTAGGGGGGAASFNGAGGSAGTATNGTINISGAQGRYGGATTTAAGDGGHAAMLWGAGGAGLEAAGNGNSATGYGGGGGGGRGATGAGGNGTGGAILVEYEN